MCTARFFCIFHCGQSHEFTEQNQIEFEQTVEKLPKNITMKRDMREMGFTEKNMKLNNKLYKLNRMTTR